MREHLPTGRKLLVMEIDRRDKLPFVESPPVRLHIGELTALAAGKATVELQGRTIEDVQMHGGGAVGDGVYVLFAGNTTLVIGGSDGDGGGGGGSYLPLTGGTLTGPLYLPAAAPTGTTQAVHKSYVDSTFLKLTGGILTGNLTVRAALNIDHTVQHMRMRDTDRTDYTNHGFIVDMNAELGRLYFYENPNYTERIRLMAPAHADAHDILFYKGDGTTAALRWDNSADSWSMAGSLLLAGNPTVPLGAATKQYVDAAIGGEPDVLGYVHVQGVAASFWTINHPLTFQPNVAVVDSTGEQVEGTVDYVDADTITVEFSAAFVGTAYLS